MFRGMKKVLAGLLAAALAFAPVSNVAAATKLPSPGTIVYPEPVKMKGNTPYYKKVQKQILEVDTNKDFEAAEGAIVGACSIKRVNPNATSVTFSIISVKNGKTYYYDKKGKKVYTGVKDAMIQYQIGRINAGAFDNASKVTKVVLSPRFRQLDAYSFRGAVSLRQINCKSVNLRYVNAAAFNGLTKAQRRSIIVYVPKATTKAQMADIKKWFKACGLLYRNIRRTKLY